LIPFEEGRSYIDVGASIVLEMPCENSAAYFRRDFRLVYVDLQLELILLLRATATRVRDGTGGKARLRQGICLGFLA